MMQTIKYVIGLESAGIILHNNLKNTIVNLDTFTHIDHYDDVINIIYQQIIMEAMNTLEYDYNLFMRKLLSSDVNIFSSLYELPELRDGIIQNKLLELYKEFTLTLFFIFHNKHVLDLGIYTSMTFILEQSTKEYIVVSKYFE